MAKEVKMTALVETSYQDIGELYDAWGKPKPALDWIMKYYQLKDSIFNKDNAAHIAELEESYQSKEKQAKIDLQDAQIKKNNLTFYFTVAGLLFIAIIAVILFIILRRFRMLNRLLTTQKEQLTLEKEKSEQLNKVKDMIFSIISHDLRSPLNSINAALTILRKKDLSTDEFRNLAIRLDTSVQAASNLLDNLLTWSRSQLKGIQINPAPVQLDKMVTECINLYQNAAFQKQLNIKSSVGKSDTVFADENVIRLVLRNLMDNAIKFSHPGQDIMVSTLMEGKSVITVVTDHGTGMDEDRLKNLFMISNKIRRNTGTASEQGSGLGLSLCAEMVKKSGGNIRIESKKNTGTSVYVSFPSGVIA